jgi:hypothetical protein
VFLALVAVLLLLPLALARSSEPALRAEAAAVAARGLRALAGVQLETGEFPTYAWSVALGVDRKWPVRSIFTVAQVLHSLGFAGERGVPSGLVDRAQAFLRAHEEPPGVWRYFGRDHEVAPGVRLSPDVDDMTTVWAAFVRRGRPMNADALALLRASKTEDGLFTTWVGDPATWTGIDSTQTDMVVNLNALFLLGLLGDSDPAVCARLRDVTRTGVFTRGTPWYPSPFAYAYFLSRAYADGRVRCLAESAADIRAWVLARQQADGGWGDDLETALGALALLNTGYRGDALPRAIAAIVARQGANGLWALAPHYTTVKPATEPAVYFGSSALTTAFCLEALGKFLQR